VTADFKIEVSRKIREEFDNGEEYYAMHGRELDMPTSPVPTDREILESHNDAAYLLLASSSHVPVAYLILANSLFLAIEVYSSMTGLLTSIKLPSTDPN
jgi:hypothetical protein